MLSPWLKTSSNPLVFFFSEPPETPLLCSSVQSEDKNCLLPLVKRVNKIKRGFFLSANFSLLKYTQPSPSKYPRTKSPKYFSGTLGNNNFLLLFCIKPSAERSLNHSLLPTWILYCILCLTFRLTLV